MEQDTETSRGNSRKFRQLSASSSALGVEYTEQCDKAFLLRTYTPCSSRIPAKELLTTHHQAERGREVKNQRKNHRDKMNSFHDTPTVGAIYDCVEATLERAEACFRHGAKELGARYLRDAWATYVRFADILRVYAGPEDNLRTRLMEAWDSYAAEDVPPLPIEDAIHSTTVPIGTLSTTAA
jgi:hypothetical protein